MEQTRESILNVAADMFSAQGYAGVSMSEIARVVGVTKAAIYHHFSNKDALYVAVVAFVFDQHTLDLTEQMSAIDDPDKRLELLVSALIEAMDEDPRFRKIYLRELLEGSEKNLAAFAENAFVVFYEPLYELMADLAPDQDGQLLIFSLGGMIFHHLDARRLAPHLPHGTKENTKIPSLANHITSLFLHGVKAL